MHPRLTAICPVSLPIRLEHRHRWGRGRTCAAPLSTAMRTSAPAVVAGRLPVSRASADGYLFHLGKTLRPHQLRRQGVAHLTWCRLSKLSLPCDVPPPTTDTDVSPDCPPSPFSSPPGSVSISSSDRLTLPPGRRTISTTPLLVPCSETGGIVLRRASNPVPRGNAFTSGFDPGFVLLVNGAPSMMLPRRRPPAARAPVAC
ncbi:hypothetical protein DFH06DRAFT_1379946 [Mycena polygramma]|nr:hypothetical protein DFH06DRAFT_1379946 [Mycena polygramma]